MLPVAAMILSSLALTGCGTERPRISLPPVDLVTCADEPASPDIPARDGSEHAQRIRDVLTLDYILALRGAWSDCRAKVDGLKAWRDLAQQSLM